MDCRSTIDERSSGVSNSERDIPSFIEPRPPLILNPFMRPRPQKGTNLLELFEEDDSVEEDAPELVQVYLRLKPSNVPSSLYEVRGDQCLITSVDTATAGHGRRTQHNVSKMYTFSHIFGPEANQKEIFEHVVKHNLRKLPDGNSFTLLTYGASGSGKTFTLMGTVKAPGLVPRSLEYVFKVVEAAQTPLYRPGEVRANKLSKAEQEHELQWVRYLRHVSAPLRDKYRRMSTRLGSDMTQSTVDLSSRTKHYVWVSFVEIYNEAIYDLLATTERTAASKLRIREDPSGNVYVKGANQAFVRTGEEAYDVMVAGKHNLQVHATGVHAHSSRSHCIFTITMLTETESGVRASHVRLCDLAGSERAARTRNTGARMQESRAINSSLHVLERCLHTLRRKQTSKQDLVPYRESKLTRLLGTGLSGTRGEAVSMVVTLNPAPEYAHETRHVLQLAAVARDIQVNNTIAESISTLESSSSHDLTIESSAEVARLRAENERLHYELVQAEAQNRKLMEQIAEQRQKNAVTVRELVEEAQDISHQYYKQQIRSLEERRETEIAELREEYEAKLARAVIADEGTPTRALQNKVMQLTKQIAIWEEKFNTERLARERINEEMMHLRACIDERDEKAAADDSNEEDAIQLTDSEDDSDETEDPLNASLEPSFRKEVFNINRSRLGRQSSMTNNTKNNTVDNLDKTHDTLKDDSMTGRDITDDEESMRDSDLSMDCPDTIKKADNKDSMSTKKENPDLWKQDSVDNSKVECKQSCRETYFVSDSIVSSCEIVETKDSDNDTGNFADISVSIKDGDDLKDISVIGDINIPKPVHDRKNFADSSVSLKDDDDLKDISVIGDINIPKPVHDRGNFADRSVSLKDDDDLKDISVIGDINIPKPVHDRGNFADRSVSRKDDDDLKDISVIGDINIPKPVQPIETQIDKIKRFAKSTVSTNTSLRNFEMLELEVNKDDTTAFKYFDNAADVKSISVSPKKKEKKTYFDDKQPSPHQISMVQDLIKKHDLLRSPSIVQDEIPEDYKPTTISQIMRESFAVSSEEPPALYKNKVLLKMHDSIDPFEDVDSPRLAIPDVLSVEEVRKSIGKVSLVNTEKEVKSEIMTEVVENEMKSENIKEFVEKDVNEEIQIDDAALHKEEKNSVSMDLDVPSAKENQCTVSTRQSKTETPEEVKTDIDVKLDILTEVKQERLSSENVVKNTEKELKTEELLQEISSLNDVTNYNHTIAPDDNTIDAFENIYKDITAASATDFELLVSDKTIDTATEHLMNKIDEAVKKVDSNEGNLKQNMESKEYNNKSYKDSDCGEDNNNHEIKHENESKEVPESNKIPIKYNLRHKTQGTSKTDTENEITEHVEKCAPRTAKKSLRLRRRNKVEEQVEEEVKLKDIVNLQKEFSDVTMGIPAPEKVVTEMPSPETETENLPPMMGVQSCPSKSVTRSRRKLFTPRAEPLDESPPPPGHSGERVRVPRPSYHRARTRRRLN